MTHAKSNRVDFLAMIALAHLTSLCSNSLPSPESCLPGNVCCALFPLISCHVKVNIAVLLRKPFPSFVMNSDFIIFYLKMRLLPSSLLITNVSKFKEIFSGGPQLAADSPPLLLRGTLSPGILLDMHDLRALLKDLLNQNPHFTKTHGQFISTSVLRNTCLKQCRLLYFKTTKNTNKQKQQ